MSVLKVLLAGNWTGHALSLAAYFSRPGWECYTGVTMAEIEELLSRHNFDLVLSDIRLADRSAIPLLGRLSNTHTQLFFSVQDEDRCWWIPAVREGVECLGTRALRPNELALQLDRMLKSSQESEAEVLHKTVSV